MSGQPDFSEFDDWLVEGPAGKWPLNFTDRAALGKDQQAIIARNAELLLDRNAWHEKAAKFDAELSKIIIKADRVAKRRKFAVRFDYHSFAAKGGQHDFHNYKFPLAVSFSNATFAKGGVSFNGVNFGDGGVSFLDVNFGDGDVSFFLATFGKGSVWFKNAVFGRGKVSFRNVKFGGGRISFEATDFGDGDVMFEAAQFGDGRVIFDAAEFGHGNVSFLRANFGDGGTSFTEVIFGDGDVSFLKATFGDGDVSFRDAIFGAGDVSFEYTSFVKGNVTLRGVRFGEGNVSFASALFQDCDLDLAFENLEATALSFKGMAIAGNLLVKADFPRQVSFERLTVDGSARFTECNFEEIPDFRKAQFGRTPEVSHMNVPAPKLDIYRDIFKACADKTAVEKLRKLKSMAIHAHDHDAAHMFFAYEMMAKKGTETIEFFPLLVNSLYGTLSGYGRSLVRPIVALIISCMVFTGLYFVMLRGTELAMAARLEFAFGFSWRHTIPLVDSLYRLVLLPSTKDFRTAFQQRFDNVHETLGNVDVFMHLAVVQLIVGAVLVLLWLLVLRNRYQQK